MPRELQHEDPLAGRSGLRTESAERNAVARALGEFAKRHQLRGCVLISFYSDRVGVNTSGIGMFAKHMEQLGDRILAAIDDGKFDPDGPVGPISTSEAEATALHDTQEGGVCF